MQITGSPSWRKPWYSIGAIRPVSNTILRQVGSRASSAAISAGVDGTFALWMTAPFRPMTQTCVSAIETSSPAKYSIVGLLFQSQSRSYRLLQKSHRPLPDVEKVSFRRCSIHRSPTERHLKNWLGGQPILRLGSARG